MKIPNAITTLILGILVTLTSLWVGQHHQLLPVDASREAFRIDQLFNTMLAISFGLVLLVEGALIYSFFAFRRRKGDETDAAPVHGNVPLEILWTAIPSIVVLWLAIYSFDIYNIVDSGGFIASHPVAHAHAIAEMAQAPPATTALAATTSAPELSALGLLPAVEGDRTITSNATADANATDGSDPATAAVRQPNIPPREEAPGLGVVTPSLGPSTAEVGHPPALQVNVTGLQFAWIFTYPDSGVIAGELHLPVDREVKLNIAANDVIHAFWVPEFRLKQDAIPGRETHLRFTPQRLGEYPVVCAELCGAYHGAMKTRVIVQTPTDYQQWLQSQAIAMAQPTPQSVSVSTPSASKMPGEFLAPHLEQMGLPTEIALAPGQE